MEPEHDEALAARLARLREAAPSEPPPALEARLRDSLAARRKRRSRLRAAAAGAGLVAAAAAIAFLLQPVRAPSTETAVSQLPSTPGQPSRTGPATGPRPPGRFRPLGAQALEADPVFTHAARVELAAETAAYFGWPVAADVPRARVQAEVLFGEDGVARGLRFLPTSFRSLPLPQERPQGVNP